MTLTSAGYIGTLVNNGVVQADRAEVASASGAGTFDLAAPGATIYPALTFDGYGPQEFGAGQLVDFVGKDSQLGFGSDAKLFNFAGTLQNFGVGDSLTFVDQGGITSAAFSGDDIVLQFDGSVNGQVEIATSSALSGSLSIVINGNSSSVIYEAAGPNLADWSAGAVQTRAAQAGNHARSGGARRGQARASLVNVCDASLRKAVLF